MRIPHSFDQTVCTYTSIFEFYIVRLRLFRRYYTVQYSIRLCSFLSKKRIFFLRWMMNIWCETDPKYSYFSFWKIYKKPKRFMLCFSIEILNFFKIIRCRICELRVSMPYKINPSFNDIIHVSTYETSYFFQLLVIKYR